MLLKIIRTKFCCIDINFSNNNNESNATQGIIKQIVKFNNNNNSLNKTMHLHCGLIAFKVKRKVLQIISAFWNKNNDIGAIIPLIPNLQGDDFSFHLILLTLQHTRLCHQVERKAATISKDYFTSIT